MGQRDEGQENLTCQGRPSACLTFMWWHCRGALSSGDTTHFQYDVAEIKLGVQDRPQWILDLQASGKGCFTHTTHCQVFVASSRSHQATMVLSGEASVECP